MKRFLLPGLIAVLVVLPSTAVGQSSMFGIRGLGVPGRGLSSRATAMGGSIGLFDPASVQAMAPVTQLDGLTLGLETLQEWRSIDNPGGTGDIRNNRFPQFRIGGPIKRVRTWLAASSSTYSNDDFGVATTDTIQIRGEPVAVVDTLVGLGGLNDLRLGAGYQINTRWSVGGAIHIITGSTRNRIRREFEDPQYQSFRDSTEISFSGVGFSLSVVGRLSRSLAVAAMLRSDGSANVTLDSTSAGNVDLPYTAAVGIRWQPSPVLIVATEGTYQTWSAINSDLLERNGVGAKNSYGVSFGMEWGWRGTMAALPIRAGIRYGLLPFPIDPNSQPKEMAVSLGTGFRFARDKASVNLSGEYVQREQTDAWTETSFLLTAGIEIRP
jgi:hypothetical protein